MGPLRCARCHDIIGVYEPMWVILSDGSEHAGSRLTLGAELLGDPQNVALHEQCHQTMAPMSVAEARAAVERGQRRPRGVVD